MADVAAVSQARYDQIDPDDNLHGAPELVIDIMSPPNTDRKLHELASLTLANGCREFWVVDADKSSVTAIRKDGSSSRFSPSRAVSLTAFVSGELALDEIFG